MTKMSIDFFEKKGNFVIMTIGSEIKRLRHARGMTQQMLAKKASVQIRHISRLENDKHSPTTELLERIAGALGVSPRDFWPKPVADGSYKAAGRLKADGDKPASPPWTVAEEPDTDEIGSGRTLIPVVGHVSGGESENLWGDGDFPVGVGFDHMAGPTDLTEANAFALEIRGDSMAPVFRDGAIVIVSPNQAANSGDFAVVRTKEGQSYFKMVWIESDQVRLTSINPAEPPMVFGKGDVRWIYPVVWARLRR